MLKEYSFENIYIRHAVDECPDDKDFNMHIHQQCEIYFFITGSVEYLVEGFKYPLSENSLMIMRPSESHKARITGSERYERFALNFPLSFVNDIDPKGILTDAFINRPLGKNNMLSAFDIDTEQVKNLFMEMCYSDDEYEKQVTIKTYLLMLLNLIKKAYSRLENSKYAPDSTEGKIVLYVNKHLFEDISIPKLSKHFYLSASQFGRIFKNATGASPWEYITKKRLTVAKEMIHQGLSAKTACEKCGFNDYSSFYRAYTKLFGCSPQQSVT